MYWIGHCIAQVCTKFVANHHFRELHFHKLVSLKVRNEMPNHCIVPMCKANYPTGHRASMFKFPKDDGMKIKWLQVIQRKHFIPTKNSRVCEFHFNPEDFETEASGYDAKRDIILTAPLQRKRLKSTAIPSVFSNYPESNVSAAATVKKFYEEEKTEEEMLQLQQAIDASGDLPAEFIKADPDREKVFSDSELHDFEEKEQSFFVFKAVKEEEKEVFPSDDYINVDDQFSYKQLTDQLDQVQKPSTRWTVSSCPAFVICVKWDTAYFSEWKIVVCQDLTAKVFLRKEEVPSLGIKITNVEKLSSLLLAVNELDISEDSRSGDS